MNVQRVWEDLRRTRSDRPAEAGKNDTRGETYTAALEQAEQLFSSAKGVGPATSPLLLFYGISQLGRALAAASPRLTDDEYRLKGHGIVSSEISWTTATLDGVESRAKAGKRPQAFQRVAQVVQACAFESKARPLGDLIDAVAVIDSDIENDFRVPKYPPLSLSPTADGSVMPLMTVGPGLMSIYVAGIPRAIFPNDSVLSLDDPIDSVSSWPGSTARERLTEFFDRYPTLRGWKLVSSEPDSLKSRRFLPPRYEVMQIMLSLPLSDGERSLPTPDRFTVDGVEVAMACPDGCGLPDHPLTLWWAILHSLSMLARYAPREWRRLIDVDRSLDAVRVEQILTAAQSTVPQLALAVLRSMRI